jgi:osmotically-inducible protein OsmY
MAHHYPERYRDESHRGSPGDGREDRGFVYRAGDEVRSWFGDEEARRRRQFDEWERQREERGRSGDRYRDSAFGYPNPVDREWRGRGAAPGRWSDDDRRYDDPLGDTFTTRSSYAERDVHRAGTPGPFDLGPYPSPGWRSAPGAAIPRSSASQISGRHGDRLREVSYAGRGPKGYRRSDERIAEDVCDRLSDAPDIDASTIEVLVTDGDVTLSGTVTNRSAKRRSEDLVEDVSGVREVRNHLRVNPPGDDAQAPLTGLSGGMF